ncbi:MAG: glutamate racemase [Bacteroidales bacterium]|nr:glutamate racemase [Bacteroidales bacterium]
MENSPIGVFDSGIGGLTVLEKLVAALPDEDFVYFADSKNAPYGPRPIEEVVDFSRKIINFLLEKNCKIIIIACNTATAAAVYQMRKEFKVPIIGLEPAVKPACLNTKTKNVGVLATEGTFRGSHFKNTSDKYKKYVSLHLEIAKELVELAENACFEGEKVDGIIEKYVNPLKENNVDYIVLGCTHYPFFRSQIEKVAGEGIKIIDSSDAVARRTKDVLMTMEILRLTNPKRKIEIYTSSTISKIDQIVKKVITEEMSIFGDVRL